MHEHAVGGPWRELRDQDDRQHEPTDETTGERDPAPPGLATAPGELALEFAGRSKSAMRDRWPRLCRPMNTSHTMNLLCAQEKLTSPAGPANIRRTPFTNTTTG